MMPKRNVVLSAKMRSSSGGRSSYTASASGSVSKSSMPSVEGRGAVHQLRRQTRSVTRYLAERCTVLIVFVQEVQPQGGFLTGADDVVQPYTLPRNLHEVLTASTTLSLQPQNAYTDVDTEQAKDSLDSARNTPPATLDDRMSEDGDELMEEAVIPNQQPVEGGQRHLKPKTMLELVEAAERKQDLGNGRSRASSSLSPKRTAVKTNADGAGVTTQDGDAVARPTKRTQAPGRADTARSRKRRKASPDGSGAEEADASPAQATPAKRARKTAPSVPASTRVLRTRPQKSETQIHEERAMEQAYRKAVAE